MIITRHKRQKDDSITNIKIYAIQTGKYEIYILRYDPKKKKGGKERGQRTTKTKIY